MIVDLSPTELWCYWCTFGAMLLASIGSGLLMIFKHRFVFIVPIMILFSIAIFIAAKDMSILTQLRVSYFHIPLYERVAILFGWILVLLMQLRQWNQQA